MDILLLETKYLHVCIVKNCFVKLCKELCNLLVKVREIKTPETVKKSKFIFSVHSHYLIGLHVCWNYVHIHLSVTHNPTIIALEILFQIYQTGAD